MPEERFYVEHRPEQSRYVLIDREAEHGSDVIGEESYLHFDSDGSAQRIMYHTVVSEEYGGLGLASVLVRHVVDDTVDAGRAIVPVCTYVEKWLTKHPEQSEHVAKVTQAHLEALRSSER